MCIQTALYFVYITYKTIQFLPVSIGLLISFFISIKAMLCLASSSPSTASASLVPCGSVLDDISNVLQKYKRLNCYAACLSRSSCMSPNFQRFSRFQLSVFLTIPFNKIYFYSSHVSACKLIIRSINNESYD